MNAPLPLTDEWESLEKIQELHGIPPEETTSIPQFYYGGRCGYAMESKGRFIPLPSEGQVRSHLRQQGVDKAKLEFYLCKIREENFVAHIGPVAGFPPGLHKAEDSGENHLVTIGPNIIPGFYGEWPFLRDFFKEMLDAPDQPSQLPAFYSWLHQARKNLTQGIRRPLPAAIFVGPRNCGKTLVIEIIRKFLGGRSAPALGALNGTTNFNADIVGAELLQIDDEIASKDHRARVNLAQGIKRQLFAPSVRVEAKGRDALSLRPIQALIIAVNDEAEHLQVLPQLDDSLQDKISLFHCRQAFLKGLDDREEIGRRIDTELPAMIYYMESFQIPEGLRNSRTGAAAWQHPYVLDLMDAISPEERFRELLLQCKVITSQIDDGMPWEGSAAELEQLLNADDTIRHSSKSLLYWAAAAGTYLARLADSNRATISKRVLHGVTRWRITSLKPLRRVTG